MSGHRTRISAAHRAAPPTMAGVRQNLPEPPTVITYADDVKQQCPLVLCGYRCPFRRSHRGPCGVIVRTETGLDYHVAWQPAGATPADAHQERLWLAEENGALWRLATCPGCGRGAETREERRDFLDHGGHLGCRADDAHDEQVHFDAEEHFA